MRVWSSQRVCVCCVAAYLPMQTNRRVVGQQIKRPFPYTYLVYRDACKILIRTSLCRHSLIVFFSVVAQQSTAMLLCYYVFEHVLVYI